MKIRRFYESSNEFYSEISIEYFEDKDIPTLFSKNEIDEVKKLFNLKKISVSIQKKRLKIRQSSDDLYYSQFVIVISKVDDEWYLVDVIEYHERPKGESIEIFGESTYYKCDQLDGLIYLLKQKIKSNWTWFIN